MLISSLCNYYDILAKSGRVLPDGYSLVDIRYIVNLTPEGKIDSIVDCQEKITTLTKKGKEKITFIPRKVIMTKRTEKPGIDANFVEHRPLYLFGLNFDKDHLSPDDRTDKARKSHKLLVEENLKLIDGLNSPVVNAYREFLKNWIPEDECENPHLLELGKNLTTSGFAIGLAGDIARLHEDSGIKSRWESIYSERNKPSENDVTSQCAVSGEIEPIARIHNKIKGFNSTGSLLVSFDKPSFASYGNEQSYNSNISNTAMKKYTEALNYLLSSRNHRSNLDDIKIVYWAADPDKDETESEIVSLFLFEDENKEDEKKIDADGAQKILEQMAKEARTGSINPQKLLSERDIDENVDFYIVGLKPNSGRLSQKFIYRKRFGQLMQNIAQHQSDLQIGDNFKSVPLYFIKNEMASPHQKDKNPDPALVAKIFESIVNGSEYPNFLLATIVLRVKTDRYVNRTRAGIIKACVNRSTRIKNKKEEIELALDLENKNPAYLCGRLFAALEKLQTDALGDLNRTIKDAYFASAVSRPALILPRLEKLAQNHLKKLGSGKPKSEAFYNRLMGEINDKLDKEYPNRLSLKEQGKFIIGYYQQREELYRKKDKQTDEVINSEEDK